MHFNVQQNKQGNLAVVLTVAYKKQIRRKRVTRWGNLNKRLSVKDNQKTEATLDLSHQGAGYRAKEWLRGHRGSREAARD